MTLKAGIDKVLIIPDEVETATETGLVLAHKKKQNPTTGTVYAIGTQDRLSHFGLYIGAKVCFEDMAGAEFKYEGQTYYAMLFSEVLAVLGD